VSALAGTRDNSDLGASIEGPLFSDWLSFRVTGRSYRKSGSYRNVAAQGQTLGDQSTKTGTLQLVAKPFDGFTVKLFALSTRDADGPTADGMLSAYEVRSNNGTENIPFVSGNTNGTIIVPSAANCTLSGFTAGVVATEARVNRPFMCGAAPSLNPQYSPATNSLEDSLLHAALANPQGRVVSPSDGIQGYGLVRTYTHLHLNLDYEVGDTGFTASSLTGLNDEMFSELDDLDNFDSTLLRNPNNATNASQALRTSWDFPFVVERRNRDFSQELRLAYDKKGAFSGILGVSYLKARGTGDLVNIQGEIINGSANPVAGQPRVTGIRVASTTNAPAEVDTTGVFAGVTYAFTDQFKVSAEGRYQSDKVKGYVGGAGLTLTPAIATTTGLTAGVYAPLSQLISKKYNNFLPRVIAQWDVSPDLMIYGSWSKGVNVSLSAFNTNFLTGSATILQAAQGLGLRVATDPEKLTNIEVGLKGKFFDNRLRASVSIYSAKWTDQLNNRSTFVQDLPIAQGGTGNIQIVSGVANSGDVKVQGVEVDLTYSPIKPVAINFSAAMNDSNIRTFSDPGTSRYTGVIDSGFRGNQLPLSSKYSMNIGAQYNGTLPSLDDGGWFVRGDLSWKDKQYVDAANLSWIKARSLVNLRAGINKGDLALEAFVNNALNDKNYVGVSGNALLTPFFTVASGIGYLNVGLPDLRTYGLKATYKF
jgi:iron complex outermembrane receptor protein